MIKLRNKNLRNAGVELQSGLSFEKNGVSVQARVIDEIIAVKKACNCRISVSAGLNGNHAVGPCSHATGYKADMNWSASPDLTKFVASNFKYIGLRGDGARRYQNDKSAAIWNLEPTSSTANHWDMEIKC